MFDLQPKSNIANKVRNTRLPRTKPLMPLFEVISNSIHAINEAENSNQLRGKGKIEIKLIRNGDEKTLSELTEIDNYPIKSIIIKDNGIGLNDENLTYFTETDTDHKLDIGGRGVGRFVCLKAFKFLVLKSHFLKNGSTLYREFEFRNTKEGFHNLKEHATNTKSVGTEVILSDFKDEYQKKAPKNLMEIAREVVTHFQLYFLRKLAPQIIIRNQNNIEVDLSKIFSSEFKKDIQTHDFEICDNKFSLVLTKASNAMSHKLHFCAHNRSVKEEGLYNRLVDLGKYSVKSNDDSFYYQAFIVGDILDQYVDIERVGFNFPDETEDEEETSEITLAKIRNGAIEGIEMLLADYLNKVRDEKVEKYKPMVYEEFPQYMSTFSAKTDEIKKLPPNLTRAKLDLELYKIESNWKFEVKELGHKIIDEKKDITNLDEYKERYEKFLSEFNEIGKAELARYIVHRKSVIELLDDLLGRNSNEKFSNEDVIHSLFFPIRTSSDEVPHNKQNLWLIDERLTYHSFLSSDKSFESIKEVDVKGDDRPDLLIFNDAIAFTEDEYPPFNSFTIVEFKKPQRDNYIDNDPKKNPLDQVEKYIDQLLEGNVENRRGRKIKLNEKTPFYVYIICDITVSFEKILKNREFNKTPDGVGYFKFKSTYYSAYIEVIPFEKVLKDAKKRNRILFEKLGLSSIKDRTLFE